MYLMLDECIWYSMNVFDIGSALCKLAFWSGSGNPQLVVTGAFCLPLLLPNFMHGRGEFEYVQIHKTHNILIKISNCCFGLLGCSTCSVPCICWQLQKSDKGQIYYWSSQTALGSGGCSVVVWLSPCSKTWKLFQTFSFWHPNTFCPYCFILT